jgi:chromosomal replication initiation ATPase DnaA
MWLQETYQRKTTLRVQGRYHSLDLHLIDAVLCPSKGPHQKLTLFEALLTKSRIVTSDTYPKRLTTS